MTRIAYNTLTLLALLLLATNASAITLTVTGGQEKPVPTAVVSFQYPDASGPPVDVSGIIENDLLLSGRYSPIPSTDFLSTPHHPDDIRYKDWRLLGAESLIIGRIDPTPDGRFRVQVEVMDVFNERLLWSQKYAPVGSENLWRLGHAIADKVYEALSGEKGPFSSRIVYVTEQRQGKNTIQQLRVAWPDGFTDDPGWTGMILRSTNQSIQSPRWSPDSNWIAYALRTVDGRRNQILAQSLISEEQIVVADFPGVTSAPAWAPDGQRLAISSSREGNPEIYSVSLSGQTQRLTRNQGIDTQPAWSPDGRYIAFTSDRSGKQQIYMMAANGGPAKRLTFNVRTAEDAFFSPDGKRLVMIGNQGDGDQVLVLDVESGNITVLSDPGIHESPTFAPNGAMVLYQTKSGGRTKLRLVRADGRAQGHDLKYPNATVLDPAWAREYIPLQ